MSKKMVLASILLVLTGGILIPSGMYTKDYIDLLVKDEIDTALLEIKEQATPLVEEIVNITLIANAINISINGVTINGTFSKGLGDADFFNNCTAEYCIEGKSFFQSIAKYINKSYGTGDLEFTSSARQMLLYGNENQNIPGLITDLNMGSGLNDFMDLYHDAETNDDKKIEMENDYLCIWEHLTYLMDWIESYANVEIVPLLAELAFVIRPELDGVTTTKEIAEFFFKSQWANASLIPEPGFPLPLGSREIYGFEVGIPEPTNMSLESVDALWNPENEYSLVNKIGLKRWWKLIDDPDSLIINSLRKFNGNLSLHSIECIKLWLVHFEENVMPYLVQYILNLPFDSTTISNILEYSAITMGSILISLASLGLTGSVIKTKFDITIPKFKILHRKKKKIPEKTIVTQYRSSNKIKLLVTLEEVPYSKPVHKEKDHVKDFFSNFRKEG